MPPKLRRLPIYRGELTGMSPFGEALLSRKYQTGSHERCPINFVKNDRKHLAL